jgi:hypothetical protein
MNILQIVLYLIAGFIVFFGMVLLQKHKNIDFGLDSTTIWIALISSLIFWPLVLLIAYPVFIAMRLLDL